MSRIANKSPVRRSIHGWGVRLTDCCYATLRIIHAPCTAYAQWMLLRRMASGAGVGRLQANMDIDSMSRAAFLSALAEEVARGDADAFFARCTKIQPINERWRIVRSVEPKLADYRHALSAAVQADPAEPRQEAARRMMADWTATGEAPHKALCRIAPCDCVEMDRKSPGVILENTRSFI